MLNYFIKNRDSQYLYKQYVLNDKDTDRFRSDVSSILWEMNILILGRSTAPNCVVSSNCIFYDDLFFLHYYYLTKLLLPQDRIADMFE